MSDLKEMLRKCSAGDMEYISDVLDNYVAFTDDSKRKKLLDKARVNWGGADWAQLIDLIDEQIRYFGSSDLAYFARSIFSKSGGAISASELIDDVYEKLLKKKSPAGKSIESRLEQLVAAVFDKEIRSKSPDELRKFFRDEMKVGNSQVEAFLEMLKPGKSVGTVAMALIQTLGPATAKVAIEKVVLALITTFLGEQLAAVAVRQILSKGPAELLGPVVWVLSSAWVVYDIQGPAFRKTIPICLFLGLVALRDGMEPVSGAQA